MKVAKAKTSQSATFKQTSATGGASDYDYTRSGNPTRTHLEKHLAKIMRARRALVVSSGMGALDVITRSLKPGDEVVTGDDLYGGSHRLLKYLSTHGGIIVHHVDTTTPEKVKEVVSEKTAMVLLETPTNPLIKIVDIPTIANMAHEANPSCMVTVDNTMLSPLLQTLLSLELTSYMSLVRNTVGAPRSHGWRASRQLGCSWREALLHHQCLRMWSCTLRLLAAHEGHKDVESAYGCSTSKCHEDSSIFGILGLQSSIPGPEEPSAIRASQLHGSGCRCRIVLRDWGHQPFPSE